MKKYKIFVSGVQKELKAERRAVKEAVLNDVLLEEYFDVFLFENAPACGKSAEASYLGEVRECDIYIGLLGDRYGTGKGISPTESEFREARKHDKEILIYIKGENGTNDKKREIGVQKLIQEIKDSKVGYSYRRFKTTNQLTNLVYESLIAFLKAKSVIGRAGFDQRICDGAKFSDIDEQKVRWCLKIAREKRNYPIAANASIEDIFTHFKLLKNDQLTNAAVLLFGKEPRKFFDQAKIKCIHLPSIEVQKPFSSYHIYEGNLFEQVDKAIGFVFEAIRFPVIQQRHTAQVRRPLEIPEFVIQEAIVNAVAHRDYNTTSSVQVMVFLDRVEILNSGSLPPSLKVGDLKKTHTSHPANTLLSAVMYYANYIQEAGSGTMEMVRQCKKAGLPEPEFVSIRNLEFKTVISRDLYTETILTGMGLNERQMKAVGLVKEKALISLSDFKSIYPEVAERTLNRDLQVLVEKGILKPKGQKKGRRYGF